PRGCVPAEDAADRHVGKPRRIKVKFIAAVLGHDHRHYSDRRWSWECHNAIIIPRARRGVNSTIVPPTKMTLSHEPVTLRWGHTWCVSRDPAAVMRRRATFGGVP